MFKQAIALLATLSVAFSDSFDDSEKGCGPCRSPVQPCAARCPDAVAEASASLIVGNFCTLLNDNDVIGLQSIVNGRSTAQTIFLNDLGCVNSGVVPLLEGIIPIMTNVSCPAPGNITILSSSFDVKGRVVVVASEELLLNGEAITVRSDYLFEAINGDCKLSLADLKVRQLECI